jgi:Penicillin binding protein transpeptidase domain
MFGKSGTAQLPKPAGQGKGYFEDRYVANFIAGAPFENPRIVVLCVIDDPDKKKGHFGGSIAGPVVRDVIDESLQYLGVKPDQIPSRRSAILSSGQDLPADAKDRVAAALIFTDVAGNEDLAAESSPDAPGASQMAVAAKSLPAHPKSRSTSTTHAPASSAKSHGTKTTGSNSAASKSAHPSTAR